MRIIKVSIILIILIGFLFELINFNETIRNVYMTYIANSAQTIGFGFFRNMGYVGEATYFAVILGINLILIQSLHFDKKKYLYSLLILLLIFLTFSKSVVISLILVFSIFFGRKKFYFWLIFILFILVLILITNYEHFFKEYFVIMANESFSSRTHTIWEHALRIWNNNQLYYFIGIGVKGLKSYYHMEGVHNQFLAFFIDFGLIGGYLTLLFFLIIIPFFLIKNIREKKFVIATNIFLIIVSVVHEPFYHSFVLAYLFFVYSLLLKKEQYEKSFNSRLV